MNRQDEGVRELEVHHQVGRLEAKIESLCNTVAELESRLQFVLRENSSDKNPESAIIDSEPLCELGRILKSHAERVAATDDRLRELMCRLEV